MSIVRRTTFNMYVVLIVTALMMGVSPTMYAAEQLHIMGAGFPVDFMTLLMEDILPPFEEKHNVEIVLETVDWGERTDRLTILLAAGMAPDVIATGYYSPYEEGASGLLLPLDPYLDRTPYLKDAIPPPVWASQSWNGSVYVVPLYFDLRAIGYSTRVFGEAGYDATVAPQSWDELLDFSRRLTRIGSDGRSLDVQGVKIWDNPAQHLLGFVYQTGIDPVDISDFRSNLNDERAVEAANFYVELNETSRPDLPTPSGGVETGRVAMELIQPHNLLRIATVLGDEMEHTLRLFAPRYSPAMNPVALAFINGLAIPAASKNPDLAWGLIAYLMEDDVQIAIHEATRWMLSRVDLAYEFLAIPGLEMFYELVPYMQPAIMPPPRNDSQNELNDLMRAAFANTMPPEEALMRAHETWSRLLNEWKQSLER